LLVTIIVMNDLIKKKLDRIAKELGSKVDYMNCSDIHGTWNKIVIEYDHKLYERDSKDENESTD